LAHFHVALADFALSSIETVAIAPGIAQRFERIERWHKGDLERLSQAIRRPDWPELASRAQGLCELFPRAAEVVQSSLVPAMNTRVRSLPCIRDIWHDHVLFEGERVSGLIDFGAMAIDCVAADIARLLGSLVGDNVQPWLQGLNAYERV